MNKIAKKKLKTNRKNQQTDYQYKTKLYIKFMYMFIHSNIYNNYMYVNVNKEENIERE